MPDSRKPSIREAVAKRDLRRFRADARWKRRLDRHVARHMCEGPRVDGVRSACPEYLRLEALP